MTPGHRPATRCAPRSAALVAAGGPGARLVALPGALLVVLLVVLLLATVVLPAAHAAHPHYQGLLRKGNIALERGDSAAAARSLRLACFGLLDEPRQLARCLVSLGLAQAGSEDDRGFDETFRRLVELEDRFGAYGEASVETDLRQRYETEVQRRIPADVLATAPGFRRLAEPEATSEVAAETPAATPAAPETGEEVARAAPSAPSSSGAPSPSGAMSSEPISSEPMSSEPAPTPSAAEADDDLDPALDPAEETRLERARALLASASRRSDLDEPLAIARQVADANPAVAEAQHLAATIAYRASRWDEAITYFRRGGDPPPEQPELLFYYAVSLYESGQPEAAARYLERSLPGLESTPFVESYREKIGSPPPETGDPDASDGEG